MSRSTRLAELLEERLQASPPQELRAHPLRRRTSPSARGLLGRLPFGRLLFGSLLVGSLLVGSMATVGLVGCSVPPESSEAVAGEAEKVVEPTGGPIVVLVLGSLRADLVGALGGEPRWTPSIDELAREADWVGRAVAASSSPIPALGTLLTGVEPWQHQALHHRISHLRPELPTLAEALAGLGYETRAFVPSERSFEKFRFSRGFDRIEESLLEPRATSPVEQALARVEGRQFLWVQLDEVAFPLEDRRQNLPRLAGRPAAPPSLEMARLMPYADPAKPLPESLRGSLVELLHHETAWADRLVGRLLRSLRTAPGWSEATVVLTAVHGMEIDEHGQTLFAQNLGRESIEVPLSIQLPAGAGQAAAELDAGRPVAAGRLWATLVELAGGRPAPVHLPSLWHRSSAPISSALYAHGGANYFSWLRPGTGGAVQLLWRSPYMEEDGRFFRAQAIEAGARQLRDGTSPKRVFARTDRAFLNQPPFEGLGRGEAKVERWTRGRGTEVVDDPELRARMLDELYRHGSRLASRPRSVREEGALWADRKPPLRDASGSR